MVVPNNSVILRKGLRRSLPKNKKEMILTKLILDKITESKDFRLGVAKSLGLSERQVQNLVKSNSENLTKYPAVKYYKSKGFLIKEIFEEENENIHPITQKGGGEKTAGV